MREFLRKYRGAIIVVALLVIPVLFLYANARGRESSGPLARAVQWVTGPVQSGLTTSWDAISGLFDRYVWLVGVEDENAQLAQEVAQLRRELQSREEEVRENQRLRRLMRLAERLPPTRVVAARVIAFGHSPSYQTIRINRGTRDGVQRRAGVLTDAGVVGRVISASRYYADVLLISDAGSRLDVMVADSRTYGVLRGEGAAGRCAIDAMDRTLELEEGALLITSGLDGVFVKGVPVGVAREVTRPTMGLYLDAEVEPHVDFARLEEVLVMVAAAEELRWPELPSDAGVVLIEDGGVEDAGLPDLGEPDLRRARRRGSRDASRPAAATPPARPQSDGGAPRPASPAAAAGAPKLDAGAPAKPEAKPEAKPATKPAAKPAPDSAGAAAGATP